MMENYTPLKITPSNMILNDMKKVPELKEKPEKSQYG